MRMKKYTKSKKEMQKYITNCVTIYALCQLLLIGIRQTLIGVPSKNLESLCTAINVIGALEMLANTHIMMTIPITLNAVNAGYDDIG